MAFAQQFPQEVPCRSFVPPEERNLPYKGASFEKRLLVRFIPVDWNDWNLFHVFRQYGLIHNIILPPMKVATAQYRYGFIEMTSLSELDKVLAALDSHGCLKVEGLGRPLQVQRAAPKVDGPEKTKHKLCCAPAVAPRVPQKLESTASLDSGISSMIAEGRTLKVKNWKNPREANGCDFRHMHGRWPVVKYTSWNHRHEQIPFSTVVTPFKIVVPSTREIGFYVLLTDEKSSYTWLDENPDDFIKKTAPCESVEENELVVAVTHNSDGEMTLLRAQVLVANGDDKALVLAVDTGLIFTTSVSDLRPLTDAVKQNSPFKAVPCALFGVSCITPPFGAAFSKVIEDQSKLRIKVVAYNGAVNLVQLMLHNHDIDAPVDVIEVFATEGLCKYEKPNKKRIVYARDEIYALKDCCVALPQKFSNVQPLRKKVK